MGDWTRALSHMLKVRKSRQGAQIVSALQTLRSYKQVHRQKSSLCPCDCRRSAIRRSKRPLGSPVLTRCPHGSLATCCEAKQASYKFVGD